MITKSSINENSFYNFDGPRINAIKKEAAALHTKAVSDYYTITTMASIGDDIEDIKKLLAKYDIEL
jgi:hypothetical protein